MLFGSDGVGRVEEGPAFGECGHRHALGAGSASMCLVLSLLDGMFAARGFSPELGLWSVLSGHKSGV